MRKKMRPTTRDGVPRYLPGAPDTRGHTWAVIYSPRRRAFFDGGERWTRDLSQAIEHPLQYGEELLAVDGEYYMLPKRAREMVAQGSWRKWREFALLPREALDESGQPRMCVTCAGRCFTCCGEIAAGRIASTVRRMN